MIKSINPFSLPRRFELENWTRFSVPAQVLSVLLSMLMGSYLTSSVILMRVNLPPKHRVSITAVLGGMRWVYSNSCLLWPWFWNRSIHMLFFLWCIDRLRGTKRPRYYVLLLKSTTIPKTTPPCASKEPPASPTNEISHLFQRAKTPHWVCPLIVFGDMLFSNNERAARASTSLLLYFLPVQYSRMPACNRVALNKPVYLASLRTLGLRISPGAIDSPCSEYACICTIIWTVLHTFQPTTIRVCFASGEMLLRQIL